MKYGIMLLLFISYTAHAGPCLSRQQQRLPLRYIYVTPTLLDNNQTQLFTGLYSYVYWNDGVFASSRRPVWTKPQQDDDAYMVDIKSAAFAPEGALHKLSLIYATIKIAPDGTQTTQKEESLTFDFGTVSGTQEPTVSHGSQTLKFLIKQEMVPQE